MKQVILARSKISIKSHPMWVRGLKLITKKFVVWEIQVAPHVGAWIETLS